MTGSLVCAAVVTPADVLALEAPLEPELDEAPLDPELDEAPLDPELVEAPEPVASLVPVVAVGSFVVKLFSLPLSHDGIESMKLQTFNRGSKPVPGPHLNEN